MVKIKQEEQTSAESVPAFTAGQLLASKQFSGVEKDVLRGLLPQDQEYTLEEARAAMKEYTERAVR